MAGRLVRINVLTVAATGALGLVALYLSHKKGVLVGPAFLAALAFGGLLLSDGRRTALLVVALPIVAEEEPGNGISFFTKFYGHVFAKSSPLDLLLLFGAFAILVEGHRHGTLRSARPFGWVLGLLALSLVTGIVTGEFGGAVRFEVLSVVQTTLPLFVVPFLIVNTVRTRRDLLQALTIAGGLAIFKGAVGLFVVFSGLAQVQIGLPRLTYYEPTANVLSVVFLLVVLGAALTRTSLPRWMWWGSPIVFACLILSYRRTFWVAALVCLAIAALIATGRAGRRFVVPLVIAVLLVGYLVVSSGLADGLQGSIVKRAASINSTAITHNQEDRYRLAERRNVLADLEASPITGLGVGVDWQQRYPLNIDVPTRSFVHMAVLWWWMKGGIVGIIAYVALLFSILIAGVTTFRRHPDPVVRIWCLAFGVGAVGIAIADLASTLIGPDFRTGTLVGAIVGLLAVAWRDARLGAETLDSIRP